MIVRFLELEVRPSKMDHVVEIARTRLFERVAPADGFLGMEVLRSMRNNEGRVMVITRWRDEQALQSFAGPLWHERPVLVDSELADHLSHISHVTHYLPVPLDTARVAQ